MLPAALTAAADSLRLDVRHAVRVHARGAASSLPALAILALGIGAATAAFSIADGLLWRPAPYPDPDAVVAVSTSYGAYESSVMSSTEIEALREEADSFEGVAAYGLESWPAALGPDGAGTLAGRSVSPPVFTLLGAAPHLGRLFNDDDARPGADGVVVLGFAAWTRRFGSDPDVVGTSVVLDGRAHEIVGVLAEGFYFPTPAEEFWKPLVIRPAKISTAESPTGFVSFHTALGRLRPGVSAGQAAAEARVLLQRGHDAPAAEAPWPLRVRVVPLRNELTRPYRPALLALTAAVALVLLLTCVSAGGLIFARGVTRRRALAVRAAFGAGRGRLARQLLVETLVLALGGGALGLAVAAGLLRSAPALAPGNVPWLEAAVLDGRALALCLLLAAASGLAAGAAPALRFSRPSLARAMNEENTASARGFPRAPVNRTWGAMVVGQVAISLVLSIGAGLLLRSFTALLAVDRGYDSENVMTGCLAGADTVVGGAGLPALIERLEALARMPGVVAAGVSSRLPLADGSDTFVGIGVPGKPGEFVEARVWLVSPGYLDALRIPVRSGRSLADGDTTAGMPAALVNETLARAVFGGEPAVGRRLPLPPFGRDVEVAGVVADVREAGLHGPGQRAEVYLSVHQPDAATAAAGGFAEAPFVAVRTARDPGAIVPFLREALADVSPYARLDDVRTLDERLSEWVAAPRFHAVLAGSFAALAVLLAAAGLYGLLSCAVAARRREIAVRMALGARRGEVAFLVVGQAAALVGAGIVLGLAGAAAASRVLESLLFGVTAGDGLTFLATPAALAAAALAACWPPVRRAGAVDPADALRMR